MLQHKRPADKLGQKSKCQEADIELQSATSHYLIYLSLFIFVRRNERTPADSCVKHSQHCFSPVLCYTRRKIWFIKRKETMCGKIPEDLHSATLWLHYTGLYKLCLQYKLVEQVSSKRCGLLRVTGTFVKLWNLNDKSELLFTLFIVN